MGLEIVGIVFLFFCGLSFIVFESGLVVIFVGMFFMFGSIGLLLRWGEIILGFIMVLVGIILVVVVSLDFI